MPTIYHQIFALQSTLKTLRSQQQRIALVPTMGNLHDGHLALVKLAKQHADIVVVSIFVNPTQFGVGEDFDSYPRTLTEDVEKLATVNADYVFAPSIDEMYPVLPPPTSILAGNITAQLCGQSRPTHFDGVGIVVAKLFNIVQPDIAVFGQKDYQQLAIIKQLVRDLSYPIDIIAAPIVRAHDGLALSSRNQYLTPSERQVAPILHRELQQFAAQIKHEEPTRQNIESLKDRFCANIMQAGFIIDYVDIKTADLQALTYRDDLLDQNQLDLMILVAATLGRARLLDNQPVSLK